MYVLLRLFQKIGLTSSLDLLGSAGSLKGNSFDGSLFHNPVMDNNNYNLQVGIGLWVVHVKTVMKAISKN